jgi:hypothetical protein
MITYKDPSKKASGVLYRKIGELYYINWSGFKSDIERLKKMG